MQKFKSFSYTSRAKKDDHDCHEHKTCTNWTSNMARILYIKNFMDYTWTNNAHKPSLHCKNIIANNETVVSISWGNNSFIICRLKSTKVQRNAICYVRQTYNLKWKCKQGTRGFLLWWNFATWQQIKRGCDLYIFWGKSVHISRGKKKVEIAIFIP